MVNQVQTGPGERVFRRHPLRIFVGALVLAAVLSTATLFILPSFLPRGMNISSRGRIVLVVAIGLTIAVFVGAFWLRNIRVVVRPDAVEIGRAGARETFPRSSTVFRSKITEHRTNGLPSGTTRALIVQSGDREITIELPGFTRATFNELMAHLNPITPPPIADPVEAARARAHLPSSFAVDAGGERRFASRLAVFAVVFFAVALVFGLLVAVPGFLDSDWSALVLIVPLAAVAGIGFAIGAVQRRRLVRAVPSQITVGPHSIRLDEVDQPYAQLTRLWMTPPAYPTKRIRFERADGRRTTHLLESARVSITPDYTDLLLAVRAQTAAFPGLLSLDLE